MTEFLPRTKSLTWFELPLGGVDFAPDGRFRFLAHSELNEMSATGDFSDRRGFVGVAGILEENVGKNKKSRTGEVRLFSSSCLN